MKGVRKEVSGHVTPFEAELLRVLNKEEISSIFKVTQAYDKVVEMLKERYGNRDVLSYTNFTELLKKHHIKTGDEALMEFAVKFLDVNEDRINYFGACNLFKATYNFKISHPTFTEKLKDTIHDLKEELAGLGVSLPENVKKVYNDYKKNGVDDITLSHIEKGYRVSIGISKDEANMGVLKEEVSPKKAEKKKKEEPVEEKPKEIVEEVKPKKEETAPQQLSIFGEITPKKNAKLVASSVKKNIKREPEEISKNKGKSHRARVAVKPAEVKPVVITPEPEVEKVEVPVVKTEAPVKPAEPVKPPQPQPQPKHVAHIPIQEEARRHPEALFTGTYLDDMLSRFGGIMPGSITMIKGQEDNITRTVIAFDWLTKIKKQNPRARVLFVSPAICESDMGYTLGRDKMKAGVECFYMNFYRDDNRQSLDKALNKQYDVVVIDAFDDLMDKVSVNDNMETGRKFLLNKLTELKSGMKGKRTAFVLVRMENDDKKYPVNTITNVVFNLYHEAGEKRFVLQSLKNTIGGRFSKVYIERYGSNLIYDVLNNRMAV